MKTILTSEECSIYDLSEEPSLIKILLTSTPETRSILNDPFITGVKYTDLLRDACSKIFRSLREETLADMSEDETVVLNILRGGLNFGLRDALASALAWNDHASAFISAQRARNTHDPGEWYITESEYRKVYVPKNVSLVFGDVVATGTSLEYALKDILKTVEDQGSQLDEIVFLTIGGKRAGDILTEIDGECRKRFPSYRQSILIYLEGCFNVATEDTPVSFKIDGTDLLRLDSIMAPEFIESQYANPCFPLERCVIYDAGSRAFWIPEYMKDVSKYWEKVYKLAEEGMTFKELLKERYPELDAARFGEMDLKTIAGKQLEKV